MLDWFNIVLAVMVIVIVGFIVRAVRKTKAEIDKGLGPAPSERNMERAIMEIHERDVECPRCGSQTFAMLGTDNRYKCDACNYEFEGAPHIDPHYG